MDTEKKMVMVEVGILSLLSNMYCSCNFSSTTGSTCQAKRFKGVRGKLHPRQEAYHTSMVPLRYHWGVSHQNSKCEMASVEMGYMLQWGLCINCSMPMVTVLILFTINGWTLVIMPWHQGVCLQLVTSGSTPYCFRSTGTLYSFGLRTAAQVAGGLNHRADKRATPESTTADMLDRQIGRRGVFCSSLALSSQLFWLTWRWGFC